jgi:small multidrug resistance family-3 protein
LAGLAEIGGGYLMWQWLREGKAWWLGVAGGIVLVLYGAVPTLQSEPAFGRVYAAYGGIFIVLSLLWSALADGWWPDRYDIIGALVALTGAAIILWGRRIF